MFWRRKRNERTQEEIWKHRCEQQEKNGYLRLKLTDEAEYNYKLGHDAPMMFYLNGYTYDLIMADILYHLLRNEICMAVWGDPRSFDLITLFQEKHIDAVYPPDTLIRSKEDSKVVAFNPIKKDLIAEEVIERCEGHGAASRLTFHALLRTPEEISGWPTAELKKLSDQGNCKFTIYPDEDWETVYFEINPKAYSKQELIRNINETLAEYNTKLEVQQ